MLGQEVSLSKDWTHCSRGTSLLHWWCGVRPGRTFQRASENQESPEKGKRVRQALFSLPSKGTWSLGTFKPQFPQFNNKDNSFSTHSLSQGKMTEVTNNRTEKESVLSAMLYPGLDLGTKTRH